MIPSVFDNDWNAFYKTCKTIKTGEENDNKALDAYRCGAMWVDLATLYSGAPRSIATVYLPPVTKAELFPKQTVILFDDTKEKTTVNLGGAENLSGSRVSATLFMMNSSDGTCSAGSENKEACKPTGKCYPFRADKIDAVDGGKKATIIFPSLKALGYGSKWENKVPNYMLEIQYKDKEEIKHICLDKVLYIEKQQSTNEETGFTAKATASNIIADNEGKGTFQVAIKKKKEKLPKKIIFDIAAADINNISSNPANIFVDSGKEEDRYIKSDGTLTFNLKNLKDDSTVVFLFYDEKKPQDAVKITVPVHLVK